MLLSVDNLSVSYGLKRVLFDISLFVEENEIVAIIGPNGAGKTTLLRSIYGIHRQKEGRVLFRKKDIGGNSCLKNLTSGVCYVPQGGRVFGNLNVRENLKMGGYALTDNHEKQKKVEEVYNLFPILSERKNQLSRTLSGGQRQMLAIGMSMMLTPQILLLDEPSIGLSPALVPQLMDAIKNINQNFGASVLIVEQNARQVLKISQRVYVMKVGKITDMDMPEKYSTKEALRTVYLSDVKEKSSKGGEN